MKKWTLILSISIASLAIYIHLSATYYPDKQAEQICAWLNSQSEALPKAGPQALNHLHTYKQSKNTKYTCSVAPLHHVYGYLYESNVLIKDNGNNLLYLVYGLDTSGRNTFQPRYFQHWSSVEHSHQ